MSDIKCAISYFFPFIFSFDPCGGKTVRHTLLPGTSNVLHLSRNIADLSSVSPRLPSQLQGRSFKICTSFQTLRALHLERMPIVRSGIMGFHCLPMGSCKRAPKADLSQTSSFPLGVCFRVFLRCIQCHLVAAILKVMNIIKRRIQNLRQEIEYPSTPSLVRSLTIGLKVMWQFFLKVVSHFCSVVDL